MVERDDKISEEGGSNVGVDCRIEHGDEVKIRVIQDKRPELHSSVKCSPPNLELRIDGSSMTNNNWFIHKA